MASLLFAFLFPYFTWKQAAGCALLLLLFNTLILPWLDLGVTEETALSAGERVASIASRVRGFLLSLAALILPRPAGEPSPGPRRLVKAPVAVHALPKGEGCRFDICLPCPAKVLGRDQPLIEELSKPGFFAETLDGVALKRSCSWVEDMSPITRAPHYS